MSDNLGNIDKCPPTAIRVPKKDRDYIKWTLRTSYSKIFNLGLKIAKERFENPGITLDAYSEREKREKWQRISTELRDKLLALEKKLKEAKQ